uniref:Uncharacterized protein n=1 Tax=Anguilla anguilla TaxID=7936 RepID=A0A0E9W5J9_ANGAN
MTCKKHLYIALGKSPDLAKFLLNIVAERQAFNLSPTFHKLKTLNIKRHILTLQLKNVNWDVPQYSTQERERTSFFVGCQRKPVN